MVTGFITFLKTTRSEETRQFYGESIGLDLVLEQAHCWIYRVAGGAYLGFCDADAPSLGPEKVVLTLLTDDVPAWHAKLSAAGVVTDGPPRENQTYHIEHFYATDPNGYLVEVQRFLDPHWDKSKS